MSGAEVVGGRFRVESRAGAGGMGVVYRAVDLVTGKTVALKVAGVASAPELARFGREVQLLAELDHPGIVSYVAHGWMPAGEPFLAMEWLSGEDLEARLARGPLGVEEAVALVSRIAEPLGYAHERGVVHRDVKPSNVFLEDGDLRRPRVLDFGIARGALQSLRVTRTGGVVGTPAYMAPEQARGDGRIDARTDVFSLGCVLYECLAGAPPFEARHVMGVLAKVLFEEPRPIEEVCPRVAPALAALVERMLSKDPTGRPADGGAVRRALEALGSASREAPPSRRGGAPAAVTEGEQRVVSLVALRLSAPDAATLTTVAAPDGTDAWRAAASAAGAYGIRLEHLSDGSHLGFVEARGAATDLAARAARFAMYVARALPGVRVAVATGLAELAARSPVGEVIDRVVHLVRSPDADGAAIATDEPTAALLAGRFDIASSGGTQRIVAETSDVDLPRLLLGRPTACVGRERELALLTGLFDECIGDRVARAALVTAPPGAGKSRLAREVVAAFRAQAPGVEVWRASGDAIGAGSPFALLGGLLRSAAGVSGAEPLEEKRAKLRARVARCVSAADVDRLVEPLWSVLDGVDPLGLGDTLDGGVQLLAMVADRTRDAFVELVGASVEGAPLVLLLDDLHWGDKPSIACLEDLLRDVRGLGLLVFSLARPEVSDTFPSLFAGRDVHKVPLAPLPRRAIAALAREVLGDVSDEDVSSLVERSAGNAFYVEELLRAFAEGRGAELPATIAAMIQQRFDHLSPEARRALRAGSITGQTCWQGSIDALVGADRSAGDAAVDADGARADARRSTLRGSTSGQSPLTSVVDELVAAELLTRRRTSRFLGEPELAFRHALVRDAAYAMLPARDRERGHAAAAAWLEAHGETDPLVLAEHYAIAGDAQGSARWFLRAARAALAAGDPDGAALRIERGIATGVAGESLGSLSVLQTELRCYAADWPGALATAKRTIELLPQSSPGWASAIGGAILTSHDMGLSAECDALIAELRGRPYTGVLDAETSMGFAAASRALSFAGRHEDGRALLRILDDTESQGGFTNETARGWACWARAIASEYVDGDAFACLAWARRGERAFKAAGDRPGELMIAFFVGVGLATLGQTEEARALLAASLRDAERLRLRYVEHLIGSLLAVVEAELGNAFEAMRLVERACEGFALGGNLMQEGVTLVSRSTFLRVVGDLDGAERDAARAVEKTRTSPTIHALALRGRSDVLKARGDLEGALAAIHEAVQRLDEVGGGGSFEPAIRGAYAALLEARGDRVSARAVHASVQALILGRAARIPDVALRQAFLDRRVNARLIAKAARALDGSI